MMTGRHGKFWLPATQPCFFREPAQGQATLVSSDDKQQADDGQGLLYCRQCHAPVTSDQERIAVLGKHGHLLANPQGLVFEVGCFALAPGAVRLGRPTAQYSWFPPHAWRLALCRSCKTHLGWYYEAMGTSPFYGLILNLLVEESN